MSKQLTDSVLSILSHTEADSSKTLKRAFLNILDTAVAETENRFSKQNLDMMMISFRLIHF